MTLDAEGNRNLGPQCQCGRPANKRGRVCCQMCWQGYGSHSITCNERIGALPEWDGEGMSIFPGPPKED